MLAPRRLHLAWTYGPLSSLPSLSHHDIGLLSHDRWTRMYSSRSTIDYPSVSFLGCDLYLRSTLVAVFPPISLDLIYSLAFFIMLLFSVFLFIFHLFVVFLLQELFMVSPVGVFLTHT